MSHKRVAIRSAIKDILIAANTDAGTRVFSGRIDPGFKPELPAILIYSTEETVDREDITKVGLRLRTVQMVIKAAVAVSAKEEAQDQLDDLAEQIEEAIDADELLNRTCETVWFDKTEFSLSPGDGENLLALVNLTYSINYRG